MCKAKKSTAKKAQKQAQKSNGSMIKKSIHEEVTERIISILERGTEEWRKTWTAAAAKGMPANASTGATYRGVNVLTLWVEAQERGYTSNKWLTYKQAAAAGGQVRKGERGTNIVFYQIREVEEDNNEEVRRYPVLRSFTVFNTDQIDGLETTETASTKAFDPIPAADQLIEASGAKIQHGSSRAAYSPTLDRIVLPRPECFDSPQNYYATGLHELAHWTGHRDRLNRDLSGRFGDEAYAAEELIAELCAAFCGATLGFVDATIEGHASYLDSWLRILKSDKAAIFTAAAAAQAAHDFLIGETEIE